MDANNNEEKKTNELDTIVAYAQLAYHTLSKTGQELNSKNIRSEIKMFHTKFGNEEVKRLVNLIVKEKK